MSLAMVQHAIETCKRHLDKTGARNSEIEAYLTRYLLVLIVAVYEEEFERLIAERAEKTNDKPLAAFVRSATHKLLRSMKLSELKGYLGRFSATHADEFSRNSAERSRLAFDVIVQSRNEVAHSGGTNVVMTLDDLDQHLTESKNILRAFELSIAS